MADLSGKVAVITGVSDGLGRGIAEGLAEAGATVYVAGRGHSEDVSQQLVGVHAVAAGVDELGGKGIAVRLDPLTDGSVGALFERVRAEQGRLDLLVNNLPQAPQQALAGGGFWEWPLSTWDDRCGVGLRGNYVASSVAASIMVAQRVGLIVNITPTGVASSELRVVDGARDAGLLHMAREMARQLEPFNVAALSLQPLQEEAERPGDASARADGGGREPTGPSPRFCGRCVAALAMDPDIMDKTGGVYRVGQLAREYRFSEFPGH